MAEIIKTFKEEIRAMRFIGKKYPNFGPMWGEWFANGWFDKLEEAMGGVEKITAIWENGGGYVGLEPDHKKDTAIWCELTFWAVEFLHIIESMK